MEQQTTDKHLHHDADNVQTDNWYYRKGNEYRSQGNWQKALECYAEAIERNPQSAARGAHEMLMNILNYRNTDLLNP